MTTETNYNLQPAIDELRAMSAKGLTSKGLGAFYQRWQEQEGAGYVEALEGEVFNIVCGKLESLLAE